MSLGVYPEYSSTRGRSYDQISLNPNKPPLIKTTTCNNNSSIETQPRRGSATRSYYYTESTAATADDNNLNENQSPSLLPPYSPFRRGYSLREGRNSKTAANRVGILSRTARYVVEEPPRLHHEENNIQRSQPPSYLARSRFFQNNSSSAFDERQNAADKVISFVSLNLKTVGDLKSKELISPDIRRIEFANDISDLDRSIENGGVKNGKLTEQSFNTPSYKFQAKSVNNGDIKEVTKYQQSINEKEIPGKAKVANEYPIRGKTIEPDSKNVQLEILSSARPREEEKFNIVNGKGKQSTIVDTEAQNFDEDISGLKSDRTWIKTERSWPTHYDIIEQIRRTSKTDLFQEPAKTLESKQIQEEKSHSDFGTNGKKKETTKIHAGDIYGKPPLNKTSDVSLSKPKVEREFSRKSPATSRANGNLNGKPRISNGADKFNNDNKIIKSNGKVSSPDRNKSKSETPGSPNKVTKSVHKTQEIKSANERNERNTTRPRHLGIKSNYKQELQKVKPATQNHNQVLQKVEQKTENENQEKRKTEIENQVLQKLDQKTENKNEEKAETLIENQILQKVKQNTENGNQEKPTVEQEFTNSINVSNGISTIESQKSSANEFLNNWLQDMLSYSSSPTEKSQSYINSNHFNPSTAAEGLPTEIPPKLGNCDIIPFDKSLSDRKEILSIPLAEIIRNSLDKKNNGIGIAASSVKKERVISERAVFKTNFQKTETNHEPELQEATSVMMASSSVKSLSYVRPCSGKSLYATLTEAHSTTRVTKKDPVVQGSFDVMSRSMTNASCSVTSDVTDVSNGFPISSRTSSVFDRKMSVSTNGDFAGSENEDDIVDWSTPLEDIEDIKVLERMLSESTIYEKRRRLRARLKEIRNVNKESTSFTAIEPADSQQTNGRDRHSQSSCDSALTSPGPDSPAPTLQGRSTTSPDSPSPTPGLLVRTTSDYYSDMASSPTDEERSTNLVDQDLDDHKRKGWSSSSTQFKMGDGSFVNGVDLESLDDELKLHDLLDNAEDFDDRKKIRERLKSVMASHRAEREEKIRLREEESENKLRKRVQEADEQKRRTLAMYDHMAKSAPAGGAKVMDINILRTGEDENEDLNDIDNNSLHVHPTPINTSSLRRSLSIPAHRVNSSRYVRGYAYSAFTSQTYTIQTNGSGGSSPSGRDTLIGGGEKIDSIEQGLRDRVRDSENHKIKLMAAYDKAAKSGPAGGPKFIDFDNVSAADTKAVKPMSPKERFQQMDAAAASKMPKSPAGAPTSPGVKNAGGLVRSPTAIKDMLLQWVKSKTREYEIEIKNFSSSWSNGMAFCALIHHFYPEAFDYNALNPKNRRYNFDLAFKVAEDKADIAPLLETDDMIMMKDKPDWKCVFTYVQSIYRRFRNTD